MKETKFNKFIKNIIKEHSQPVKFFSEKQGLDMLLRGNGNFLCNGARNILDNPEIMEQLKNSDTDVLNKMIEILQEIKFTISENERFFTIRDTIPYYDNLINILRNIIFNKENGYSTTNSEINSSLSEEDNNDIDTQDSSCFNTVPKVVKEVVPRSYRRGLKALSLANRKKFNMLNNIKTQTPVQQPVTSNITTDLHNINTPIKNSFTNMVYQPSITQLTKEVRREAERKLFNRRTGFETQDNYNQVTQSIIKERNKKKF